jgi:tripartite-type tricarboxylate transporter receptor subunit TctC
VQYVRYAAAVLFVFAFGTHAAQPAYPSKVIRIVTAEAGAGGDLVARVVAQGLSESLRQPVVVENRSGVQSIDIAAHAAPDGYTLLVQGSGIWLLPFMRSHVSWDPLKDLAPIAIAASSPNLVAVHPAVAVSSVQELIAAAKAKPGALTFGASFGGSTHIASELFKRMAAIDLRHIPYKGNGPALNALISGETQVMFPNAASGMPHVKSGRIRALAVTSPEPSRLAPGLPTVASAGLPGYESMSFHVLMAPAGTPKPVLATVHDAAAAHLRSAEATKRLLAAGTEGVGSTPAALTQRITSEMARLGPIIREAQIRAD